MIKIDRENNELFKEAFEHFDKVVFQEVESTNCFIAGGALRDYFSIGKSKSDIDVFFTNEIDFDAAVSGLKEKEYEVVVDNENGILFKKDRRLIHLIRKEWYVSMEHCLNQFDFTVCCVALSPENIVHHDRFFIDLAKRRLVINSLPYPLSTMQRLQKYFHKGYWICNGGILEIAQAINQLNLEDPEQDVITYSPGGGKRFVRID